jgi:SAM-dependent methyltransferase
VLQPTKQDAGNAEFDRQYARGSSRLANEGLIGVRYRLPKSVSMLAERFKDSGPLEVLEIGAGIGEVARLLKRSGLAIKRYVGIEYSFHAAKRMRQKGYVTAQMNAEQLAFADNSFDLVFCFDVMHHVNSPKRMAHEIVRVTRKHFLLSEPNHLSFARRLGEIHPGAKSRAERSFTPATYRKFFPASPLTSIEIEPFYVLVPPKAPRVLIPYIIRVSEAGQKIPGVRWIGQSLLIAGTKHQNGQAEPTAPVE